MAGALCLILIAFGLSSNRRKIKIRQVCGAFITQIVIAILILYVPFGQNMMAALARFVNNFIGYASAGSAFLFGPLATSPLGHNFAMQALPVLIFFSSLISILYHLGMMQFLVRWIGGAIEKLTQIGRVEAINCATNIFVGQSESPLVVGPYLGELPPERLFTIMVTGMSGIAGTLLAAYAQMGIRLDYLLTANLMAAPAGIMMAKIMMPDLTESAAFEEKIAPHQKKSANIIMAAAEGAQQGVKLAVAVGAMVMAFVALVAMANGFCSMVGSWFGWPDLTFQSLIGAAFRPVMWLVGVPWSEAGTAGGLMGEKVILNEFIAYIHFGQITSGLSPHTMAIVTFALCGFANISSIAIQMAVTGGIVPHQRPVIARLGGRALVAAMLANLMSATLAGLLVS
ncbi:MAG: nucleoside transporter C-terminal domain-containing protein [Zymomonas mobilis]|uniref:NupC/NupG family nucleoside CNT transporter n=1 Tax=Zymomonas mobilis TaxID=542 RepID=UPI001154186C|nr:nucleoside transporter C-terminal domain-containing protein [Zymomonas mobilis]